MKRSLATFLLGLVLLTSRGIVAQDLPLIPVENTTAFGLDEQLWTILGNNGDKWSLIRAISYSLRYLDTPKAIQAYENYPVSGVTRDRVRRSLVRFQELLKTVKSPKELQAAVQKEFILYQSIGNDHQGTVHFTGYFEPIYPASRQKTAQYRYPLYRKPSGFDNWLKPHPKRIELEGKDGLGSNRFLRGSELVWMRDRLEAYLVHIQGSAKLTLPDGKVMSIGYDGSTDYPYTSIGRELIKDGIFTAEQLSLPVLIDYLGKNPQETAKYLPRNERFIFFRETNGEPAMGSIGVPVTAERSIATDKSIMPPGGLALIDTRLPYLKANGEIETRLVSRYVLDQDTGSAIKGPGRVDIFMGTGKEAGDRAGLISQTGQLYYLLVK